MPHPSKMVDDSRRRMVDESSEQVVADEENVSDRTPAEMLDVLRRIVNRDVDALDKLTNGGKRPLPQEYAFGFDDLLDRVCKLAREDRARPLTDEELLERHDRERGQ